MFFYILVHYINIQAQAIEKYISQYIPTKNKKSTVFTKYYHIYYFNIKSIYTIL